MARAAELYDAEREARAERRARALLRSCVNTEDWAMYEELGLIRVWGQADRPQRTTQSATKAAYAYLIYPHKPIVAYLVQSLRVVGEYCVAFAHGSERLPPSDDVLAKWLALTGDERALITSANPLDVGRQLDPARVRGDLERLRAWGSDR
jgi:hypothetical protein